MEGREQGLREFYESGKSVMKIEVAERLIRDEVTLVHGTTISTIPRILETGLLMSRSIEQMVVAPVNASDLANYHWGEPRIMEPLANIIIGIPREILNTDNVSGLNKNSLTNNVYTNFLNCLPIEISYKQIVAGLTLEQRMILEQETNKLKKQIELEKLTPLEPFAFSAEDKLSGLLRSYRLNSDRVIPSEFIKGYTDSKGNYIPNPNYINLRLDKFSLICHHQQRINKRFVELGGDLSKIPQKKISKVGLMVEHFRLTQK